MKQAASLVFSGSHAQFYLHDRPLLESYLAGLWEGNGHITTPVWNQQGGWTNTPGVFITFREADRNTIEFFRRIAKRWGGWVREKPESHSLVWSITAFSELLSLLSALNGHLRTPKIHQFSLLLKAMQEKDGTQPSVQPVDNSCLADNAWLAGFITADGGFKIPTSDQKRAGGEMGMRIELRFVLEQRQYHPLTGDPSEPFMKKLADYLACNLKTSKHHGNEYWCVECSAQQKCKKISQYFSQYPILTSRENDFKDWKTALLMVLEKKHLLEAGRAEIVQLKQGMNDSRLHFDWSHLC